MAIREIKRIVTGYQTKDGAGVKLIRVLSGNDVQDIDPFLMLDAFGSEIPEDYLPGFPMHPHRGIETITYILEGHVIHTDSLGNKGSLKSGELQWMTSGRGILHEEMPQNTGKLDGLQFWLNLPAKDKMTEPRYFLITQDLIKTIEIDGGKILLIAGEYNGIKAVEGHFVKITMMDIQLEPGAKLDIPVSSEKNCFVYIFEGDAVFGDSKQPALKYSAAIFGAGDAVSMTSGNDGVRLLLLAGKPLEEPIAWGGSVVMNTQEELKKAYQELSDGTFIK